MNFRRDHTIETDSNEEIEFLSTDSRVYWNRAGYFEMQDGENAQDVADDAEVAGYTVTWQGTL